MLGSFVTLDWILSRGFTKKPVTLVEDHLFHIEDVLAQVAKWPQPLSGQMTVVCLDRPGPDTEAAVVTWLERFPALQVAANIRPGELGGLPRHQRDRLLKLEETVFTNLHQYCKTLAQVIRPDGLMIQDIQLSTLRFLPQDAWWSSIYLANTLRGMFSPRAISCRFMSNKSGFDIGFGRELMEAGFDPRDVIDKNDLAKIICPVFDEFLATAMPWTLEVSQAQQEPIIQRMPPGDRDTLEQTLDLIWWPCSGTGPQLSGRALKPRGSKSKIICKPREQEAITWQDLTADYMNAGQGLSIDAIGRRLCAPHALKAERTNSAARHIHSLRARLANPAHILTAEHAYLLDPTLTVGRVITS